MEWMPIETAPKDGSGFIAYQSVNETQHITSSCAFVDGRFVWVNFGEADHTDAEPTHWMPLPSPPKIIKETI